MKVEIVYPKWPKMEFQPEFHLPPHGPVVFAATLPDYAEISFRDEHVQPIDFETSADLVFVSCMLTCQMPRAWEVADEYRARGKTVVFGGIGTHLHYEQTLSHADAVFLGETEGRMEAVLEDFANGTLKPIYDYRNQFPDTRLIKPARRHILSRNLYNYRGVQMVDLVHASRGCRFDCFPCCTPYLGGCRFRPRPYEDVVAELEGIDNNRIFFVDNSMANDDEWLKGLLRAIAPLKIKWISHPLKDNPEILDLAAEAGCWYVYQAIFNTADVIRDRVRHLKERGIGVEGTVILGTDDQDVDGIKRLVEFLVEMDLDLAEFTVLTPFPHTPVRADMESQGRILHNDWIRYTGAETVFRPARMSVDDLDRMHRYAWETFYGPGGKEVRMGQLYKNVIEKEMADGTFRSHRVRRERAWSRADGNSGA